MQQGLELAISVYAEYYLSLVQEAELQLARGEQKNWLDRLEWEQNNIRAVLNWFIE
jgi:hypothetical protein